jgi:uncharacterized protein YdhG (YjbR/CyaY superfamily)
MAKAKSKPTEAEQVEEWMARLDASFKPSINAVRKIIKAAGPRLIERIKWNPPSYYYKEDIVTFGPTKAKDKIILVFHHPSIVKIKSDLLQGNYKDRRLVYLNSMKEIKDAQKELERIIKESVAMIDK